MTKETLFQNIQELTPILHEFNQKGTATLTLEQSEKIGQSYLEIQPGTQINLSCSSCVVWYLTVMASWYEREYPKYLDELHPNQTTGIADTSTPQLDKAQTVEPHKKSPGRPRKKHQG